MRQHEAGVEPAQQAQRSIVNNDTKPPKLVSLALKHPGGGAT